MIRSKKSQSTQKLSMTTVIRFFYFKNIYELLLLRFKKAVRVWFCGARETH